jgi:radical SAM protein with 4Fe4S-binding SPASM domain
MPSRQVMGLSLFEHILNEIGINYAKEKLNVISFAAYNEPTLDPHFKKRIRMLTEFGFQYWFISNGSYLTADLVEFIIHERIAIYGFLFNVPAIDPDDFHNAVQAPAEKILAIRKNLIYLLEQSDKISADITIIVHGDQGHVHHHNYQRMQAFFQPYRVRVVSGSVMNRAGMLAEVVNQKIDHQTDRLACSADYFNNIYVGVNGNVYLCCHDYFQKFSYGDIRKASLEEIRESKNDYIETSSFKNQFCRRCPFAITL